MGQDSPQHGRRRQVVSAGHCGGAWGRGCLTIVFMDPMNYDMGKRPTVIGELERYVEANFGRSIYFKTRLAGRGERLNTIYVTQEELEEKIHMDITYEDE